MKTQQLAAWLMLVVPVVLLKRRKVLFRALQEIVSGNTNFFDLFCHNNSLFFSKYFYYALYFTALH